MKTLYEVPNPTAVHHTHALFVKTDDAMERSKATSLGATLFLIFSTATETCFVLLFFFFFKPLANSPYRQEDERNQ